MAKKFYWLKLKEDFFEDDAIGWLEEQKNGKEYCLFYMKMCLKSLKTDGILSRKVGDTIIPYDTKKLAEMTNTKEKIVKDALAILQQIGLIQIWGNGEIYMVQLENMTGSETSEAEKKRRQRARQTEDTPETSAGQLEDIEGTLSRTLSDRDRVRDRDKSLETETDIDFTSFWSVYPKQTEKESAYIEWSTLISAGYLATDLIQASKNYAEEVVDYASRYIKQPKNFLADRAFVDYMGINFKKKDSKIVPMKNNRFTNCGQRKYTKDDIDNLERQLLQAHK